MNIFEALRADHDRQRELIDRLLDTHGDSDDRRELFEQLELSRHLTPSRSNGLNSMVEYIRTTAAAITSS